jgi:hypothetical protein
VLAACGGGGGGSAVTRDSAGITIVENSGPVWGARDGWTLADTPFVQIGSAGGSDPAYELDQVRGPVRLSDGRLVIANAGSNEIRFYGSDGVHLRTSGRAGSGPGEYQSIMGIWLGPADSLLVGEIFNRRLTVLDSAGNAVRTFSLGGAGGTLAPTDGKVEMAIPTGWAGDGTVLGAAQTFVINQQRSGRYRDSFPMIQYGPDGATRDTLGRFPGLEMEQMTLTFGGQTMSTPTEVPLGGRTVVAAGRDRIFVAQNLAWEIEIRDVSGKLLGLARAAAEPTPITPSDVTADRKQRLELVEGMPQMRGVPDVIKNQVTARINEATYPEAMPYFVNLLVDAEGNLWAQLGSSPAVPRQQWAVLDPRGQWLGTITMPEDFTPTFITAEGVYGLWRDQDSVEHIRGYALQKGGAP